MKKYLNITKHFNTVPRTFLLVWIIIHILWTVFFQVRTFLVGKMLMEIWIGFLIGHIVIFGFLFYLYYSQFALERTRIAKQLRRRWGFSKEEVVEALNQINEELEYPRYSDVTERQKCYSFFVTDNWVIGTEGNVALRVNAVNISNIKSVAKEEEFVFSNNGPKAYHTLFVMDKKGYIHEFFQRDVECMNKAYNFLINIL